MTRLGFLWARWRGDEAALQRLSCPAGVVLAELAGRTVALVGNARSLSQHRLGAEIDAADLVIRLNAAPIPDRASHGSRTDWIGLSTPLPASVLAARAPRRVLWMTPKRHRLPFGLTRHPGFHLNPLTPALHAALTGPPTTGLRMIDLLARSHAARVTLYGFDFFASLSLSGSRTAAQVPHDFAGEQAFVRALIARDPRFTLRP